MNKEEFPKESAIISDDSYMDDISFCANSIEEAERTKSGINKVLASGGFKIKGWISSIPKQSKDETKSRYTSVGVNWCFHHTKLRHPAISNRC